jgi:hypothetical protein
MAAILLPQGGGFLYFKRESGVWAIDHKTAIPDNIHSEDDICRLE